MDAKQFRSEALKNLTDDIGVYALCDLDQVPIYIGQSIDGIRSRVRRHLTSARSDIIANRQIDVWEIAYVWAWPVPDQALVEPLESTLFARFNSQSTLMNGKILTPPTTMPAIIAAPQIIQVVEEQERRLRLQPEQRLPRQISQYLHLVDYILTVKDAAHLKRSLDAHFERLVKYHSGFLAST